MYFLFVCLGCQGFVVYACWVRVKMKLGGQGGGEDLEELRDEKRMIKIYM